jgi:aspartyl-tRNA(Asn)/glutamyl-tRNA(Gln) amidotransferase subunit B
MKNLNSFKAIIRAIEAEAKRQINEIESGRQVIQETRRWDDDKGMSFPMRSKEEAHDYRYFPEPDIVPIVVGREWLETIMKSLPELPADRKRRFVSEYGLPEYDSGMLTSSKVLADFFEDAAAKSGNVKAVSNWIMGDLMKTLKERDLEAEDIPFPAGYLAKLVYLIDKGTISGTIAKKVFTKMFDTKKDPEIIVKEEGLEVVNDVSELSDAVKKVIENNPKSVEDYRGGKDKAIGFLVGQVMKETRGKADPQIVNKLLKEELEK